MFKLIERKRRVLALSGVLIGSSMLGVGCDQQSSKPEVFEIGPMTDERQVRFDKAMDDSIQALAEQDFDMAKGHLEEAKIFVLGDPQRGERVAELADRINTEEATVTAAKALLEFRLALTNTTRSINAGRLDDAKEALELAATHLESAVGSPNEADQEAVLSGERQITSLVALINGSEAMMKGKVKEAVQAWSAIDDPVLKAEVQRKAAAIGVQVL